MKSRIQKEEHQAKTTIPKNSKATAFQLTSVAPENTSQNNRQKLANNSPKTTQLKAIQDMANNSQVIQQKANNTGLPNQLKSGVENLSGIAMDDVKVHYNSSKPAQLQAHAYAQGTDIHLAPGQEKHLPHEAWHVVQQKQGRVQPTTQLKGKVNVNDDVGLEREADLMGGKAMQRKHSIRKTEPQTNLNHSISQRKQTVISLKKIAIAPPKANRLILPCGHGSMGTIQRMITVTPPTGEGVTLDDLEKYVFGTPINNRRQTFEHAATESHIGAMRFLHLKELLSEKNVAASLAKIHEIIEVVNTKEAGAPNHPNPVWASSHMDQLTPASPDKSAAAVDMAKTHEAAYTISKTAKSVHLADEARKAILASRLIAERFMLGVLVLPNGKIIVALSGSRGDILGKITGILKARFSLLNDMVYDVRSIHHTDNTTYRAAAAQGAGRHDHFEEDKGKIVRKRSAKDDLGSYPATCAAAVALSVAKQESPKSFLGDDRLGLTEVYVSPNERSEVLVYNAMSGRGDRLTMKDKDVPSCHVCQMQLAGVAREVVAMERGGIVEHLQQDRVMKEQEMKAMRVSLEQLTAQQEASQIAGKDEAKLEVLVEEARGIQDKTRSQLIQEQKALDRVSRELQRATRSVSAIQRKIDTLLEANRQTEADVTEKQKRISEIQRLEKDIRILEDQIRALEQDQTTLTQSSGLSHAMSGYAAWHSKLAELQRKEPFKVSTKDTIARDITAQQGALRRELGKKHEARRVFPATEALESEKDHLEQQRRRDNETREGHEKDQKQPRADVARLSQGMQGRSANTAALEKELQVATEKCKALESQLDTSSRAAREARKIARQISKLEKDIKQSETEMRRLQMTLAVYS